MKMWAKVCLITGTACTIAGAALCGIGIVGHGLNYLRTADLNTLNSSGTNASPVVLEKTKINAFQALDLTLGDLDLEVLPSGDENFYLSYTVSRSGNEDPITWEVKNNTLSLTENTSGNSNHYFHIDIGFLSEILEHQDPDALDMNTIRLYLPKGTVLSDALISNNYGEMLLSDLSADKGTITLPNGSLDIKNCKLENCTVTSEFGDVDVNSSDLTDCTFTLSDGDADFEDVVFDGINHVSCELGDISVESRRQSLLKLNLTASTNLGSIDLDDDLKKDFMKTAGDSECVIHTRKNNQSELTLHSDDGDIELE